MLLTTERLILREFNADDWQDLHAIESDSEVARHAFIEGAWVDSVIYAILDREWHEFT